MTKRLAQTIGAGVAAVLIAGVAAFIVGWSPAPSSARTRSRDMVENPARIVTPHQDAPAEGSGDRPQITVARSPAPSQGSQSADDSNEDEGFQDDHNQDDVDSQDDSLQEEADDSERDNHQEDVGTQHDHHDEDDGFQDEGEGGGDD